MLCERCQAEVAELSMFCLHCGQPVDPGGAQPAPGPAELSAALRRRQVLSNAITAKRAERQPVAPSAPLTTAPEALQEAFPSGGVSGTPPSNAWRTATVLLVIVLLSVIAGLIVGRVSAPVTPPVQPPPVVSLATPAQPLVLAPSAPAATPPPNTSAPGDSPPAPSPEPAMDAQQPGTDAATQSMDGQGSEAGKPEGAVGQGDEPTPQTPAANLEAEVKVLIEAHQKAVAGYRAGVIGEAVELLEPAVNATHLCMTGADDAEAKVQRVLLACNDFAFFLTEVHRNDEAELLLREVIRRDPLRAVAWLNLGDALWGQERRLLACASYREYLALAPRGVPSRIADRCSSEGQPTDSGSLMLISAHRAAMERHQSGQTAEAAADMEPAVRSSGLCAMGTDSAEASFPAIIAACNDYAYFLQETGKPALAIGLLREVVRRAPSRAVAWLNLGDALWLKDQKVEACAAYDRYVALSPRSGDPRVAERCGG